MPRIEFIPDAMAMGRSMWLDPGAKLDSPPQRNTHLSSARLDTGPYTILIKDTEDTLRLSVCYLNCKLKQNREAGAAGGRRHPAAART